MDANGNLVIAWESYQQDGSMLGIYAQRYNAAGVPQGAEFRANTVVPFDQESPSIAMDANGNFVIAWQSFQQDGSLFGIYARRYSAAGVPQTEEFRINTVTIGSQHDVSAAMDADGDFVVPWEFGDIFAQRYAIEPELTGSEFQFETGPQALSFAFDRDVGASLGTDDLVLQNLTTSQTIPAADLLLSYNANTATFSYTGSGSGITGVLPDADYRATLLADGITTPAGAPLAANVTFNFFFLNGDANRDGAVNLADYNVLAGNFGQSPRTFSQGDFTYDTVVDLTDFNVLAARFGHALAAATFARRPIVGARVGDESRKLLEERT